MLRCFWQIFLPNLGVDQAYWQQPLWDATMATSLASKDLGPSQTDVNLVITVTEKLD